jgi:hypothetical protein
VRARMLAQRPQGRAKVHRPACGFLLDAASGGFLLVLIFVPNISYIGSSCKECDGGDKGSANPSAKDRCGSGMKATVNDPLQRTVNRNAVAFSEEDWTRWNPVRSVVSAPFEIMFYLIDELSGSGVLQAVHPCMILAAERAGARMRLAATASSRTQSTRSSATWARSCLCFPLAPSGSRAKPWRRCGRSGRTMSVVISSGYSQLMFAQTKIHLLK